MSDTPFDLEDLNALLDKADETKEAAIRLGVDPDSLKVDAFQFDDEDPHVEPEVQPQPKSLSRETRTEKLIYDNMLARLGSVLRGKVNITRIWEVGSEIPSAVNDVAMQAYDRFLLGHDIEGDEFPDDFEDISKIRTIGIAQHAGRSALLMYRYFSLVLFDPSNDFLGQDLEAHAQKVGGLPHVRFKQKNFAVIRDGVREDVVRTQAKSRWHTLLAVNPAMDGEMPHGPELPSYVHWYADRPQPHVNNEGFHDNLIKAIKKAMHSPDELDLKSFEV